jgi:hypothetical protein
MRSVGSSEEAESVAYELPVGLRPRLGTRCATSGVNRRGRQLCIYASSCFFQA